MKHQSHLNAACRRHFHATFAVDPVTLSTCKLVRATSPNVKVQHAFVGVAGRCTGNLDDLTKDPGVEVAAICDVKRTALERVTERFPKIRKQVKLSRLAQGASKLTWILHRVNRQHLIFSSPVSPFGPIPILAA